MVDLVDVQPVFQLFRNKLPPPLLCGSQNGQAVFTARFNAAHGSGRSGTGNPTTGTGTVVFSEGLLKGQGTSKSSRADHSITSSVASRVGFNAVTASVISQTCGTGAVHRGYTPVVRS